MKNNKIPSLFEVNIEKKEEKLSPKEEKARAEEKKSSDFLNKIRDEGFILAHKIYLQNYINADIAIALAHIKNCYKTYVVKGGWPEDKFEGIMLIIARNRQMMIPAAFLKHGVQYDLGKLTKDIQIEKKKLENALLSHGQQSSQSESQISKEEQELLDYIAKNGGGK